MLFSSHCNRWRWESALGTKYLKQMSNTRNWVKDDSCVLYRNVVERSSVVWKFIFRFSCIEWLESLFGHDNSPNEDTVTFIYRSALFWRINLFICWHDFGHFPISAPTQKKNRGQQRIQRQNINVQPYPQLCNEQQSWLTCLHGDVSATSLKRYCY